jgi:hypothetical protein
MMGNGEGVKEKISLILKGDIIKNEDFKIKVQRLDNKVQKMLLWSTLCAVWSYLVLIIVIARIYSSFHGKHQALLIASLIFMYLLMGILIWFVWKSINYKRSHFYAASKSHIRYQLDKLTGQRKLITCYMTEYSVILLVSSAFFLLDFEHGMSALLKITAPVSIMTYTLGIYFLANFTKQMKKLKLIEKQIDQVLMGNLNKN